MEFIQIKVNVLFVDLSSFAIAQKVYSIAPLLKNIFAVIFLATTDLLSLKNESNSQGSDNTITTLRFHRLSKFKWEETITLRASRCTSDENVFFELLEKKSCLHVRLCVLGFKSMISVRFATVLISLG